MRLATAAVAALCLLVLVERDLTWRMDTWIYDFVLSRTTQQVDEQILMVVIDERSLSAIGRWPWPRGTHAELLDRLDAARVRGVALNAIFAEPARDDPKDDALLAGAVARAGNVALPVMAEASEAGGMPIEVMPMPALMEAPVALGHVDAEIDRDGTVRQAYLMAGLGSPHWPTLALALLRTVDAAAYPQLPGLAAPDDLQASPFQWVRDHRILIPYARPGDFPQVSYIDVLQGKVEPDLLADRLVVVGTAASGLDHGLPTPRSGDRGRLSTAEYHANLLNTLLLGHAITPLTALQQWLLTAAFSLLPLALYRPHSRWLRSWLVSALAAAATLACCLLLLRYGRYWFPPTPALLALAAVATAWSIQAIRQSQRLAYSDALTRVANRRMFDLMLTRELRAARRSGHPLSLLLIDVDHFKRYNDRYGHQGGDEVLQRVAAAIVGRVGRPRDLTARYGGDELATILPETGAKVAQRIAGAIIRDVRDLAIPHEDSDLGGQVTVTIGVATFDPLVDAGDADLVNRTDSALYRAKRDGRNCARHADFD